MGPRFAIVDYKTNWLGPADEPLTLAHYQPEALAAEMSRAHYGLQALLYTVALHRYLRWRLPGYEPGRHLAGVLYLFLRGMARRTRGTGRGCSRGDHPAHSCEALSDVLDREQPGERASLIRSRHGGPRAPPGCCASSTTSACCRPPTCTSRCGSAELVGEDDEAVRLAVALAVRGPRLGHVFVDLATIRDTASVESDEPVDLSALPWPETERVDSSARPQRPGGLR